VIVSAWRGEVQPWTEAVVARGPFFNLGDLAIEDIPDQDMLKFFYEKRSAKLLEDLHGKVQAARCYYPTPTRFGAPDAQDYPTMNKQQVRTALWVINFGSTLVDMLVKAKAAEITRVVVWPSRFEYDDLLSMRTAGLEFKITMENFVKFVEDELRTADRYFNINAISIQNRYLRSPQKPLLEVRMLLTQARFREGASQDPGAASGSATPEQPALGRGVGGFEGLIGPDGKIISGFSGFGRQRAGRDGEQKTGPPSRIGRAVRWLDKHFWPFN